MENEKGKCTKKEIRITCRGAETRPYKTLTPLQGDLKNLSMGNYRKLRKEILELGFCDPICIWRHDEKDYIISGTQRTRVITQMVEDEGYTCPPLPVSIVEADDVKQAKLKILALTSQYGEITESGLVDFIEDIGIEAVELEESFRFPEIGNLAPPDVPPPPPGPDDAYKGDKKVKCPECGHEFDA